MNLQVPESSSHPLKFPLDFWLLLLPLFVTYPQLHKIHAKFTSGARFSSRPVPPLPLVTNNFRARKTHIIITAAIESLHGNGASNLPLPMGKFNKQDASNFFSSAVARRMEDRERIVPLRYLDADMLLILSPPPVGKCPFATLATLAYLNHFFNK